MSIRSWFLLIFLASLGCARSDEAYRAMIREGDRLFQLGKHAQAAETFKAASERFPKAALPRLAWGHALFAVGDFTQASKILQQGVTRQPSWAREPLDLAAFFARYPRILNKRLRELERLTDLDRKNEEFLFLYGYALHFTGQRKKSRRMFERLLDADSEHRLASAFIDAAQPPKTRLASAIPLEF